MKKSNITFGQLHCPQCGWVIPAGQRKCINPNCPTNKPLKG